MFKWLINKIKRRFNVNDLLSDDAIVIYEIIMASEDQQMIDATNRALKCSAESSMGMYAMASSWNGTPIPPVVLSEIKEQYGVEDLYGRNLLSADGRLIELNVLANALPEEMRMKHFHFDIEAKAAEHGIDLNSVRELFRKFVIRFQKNDWDEEEIVVSSDFDLVTHKGILSKVLGLGMISKGDKEHIIMGKLVCENIKKLMEDDNIFCEKFKFLDNV